MTSRKIHLPAVLARMEEFWRPEDVGRANDHVVRVARFHGEYDWHRHDDTDELFLCLRGGFLLQLRDGEVALTQGDLFVVPRGTEHRPVAHEEAHVVLVERAGSRPSGSDPGRR